MTPDLSVAALGRIGSLREGFKQRPVSTMGFGYAPKQNGLAMEGGDSELADAAPHAFHKAVLYVLGEKTPMKVSAQYISI